MERSISNLRKSISKETDSKEIMFKMSKKIAQLTKVIYYLNTKNEDCDTKINSMQIAFDQEISEIIKDGGMIINEMNIKQLESERREEGLQSSIKVILILPF